MNSAIRKSLIIIMLISAMGAVGFTTAYFSDTELSQNNTFQAGSLDLEIGEPKNAVWIVEDWLPGDEVSGEIELENVGSLSISGLIFEVEIE